MVGSLVWIEDPEVAWLDGEVLEVNGQDIKVLCTSGTTVSDTSQDITFDLLCLTVSYC